MPSAWQSHLTAYRAAHPRLSLKACMQEASKTYRSSHSVASAAPRRPPAKGVKAASNPWLAHVQAYRNAHPEVSYSDALRHASCSYRGKMNLKACESFSDLMYGRIASANINKAPSSFGFRKDTVLHLDVAGILWGNGSCDGAVLAKDLMYVQEKTNPEVVEFFESAYEHISQGRLPRSFDCSTTTEFYFRNTSEKNKFLETFLAFIEFLKTGVGAVSLKGKNHFGIFDGEKSLTRPSRLNVKTLFDEWRKTD